MFKCSPGRLACVALGLAVALSSWAADSRAPRKKLVMLVSEPEYQTARTLPVFAARHLEKDFRVVIVSGGAAGNENGFDRISELVDADVLLVSVRRRTPPKAELDLVRRHVAAGRPVIGIRTASHAFAMNAAQKMTPGGADWREWDAEVLGGNYTGHYDRGPLTTVRAAGAAHPILEGVSLPFTSDATLYRTSPLRPGAQVLVTGEIEGQPAEPLAWTFTHRGGGRAFYLSLGNVNDFSNPSFARLLKNGITWAASGPEQAR